MSLSKTEGQRKKRLEESKSQRHEVSSYSFHLFIDKGPKVRGKPLADLTKVLKEEGETEDFLFSFRSFVKAPSGHVHIEGK